MVTIIFGPNIGQTSTLKENDNYTRIHDDVLFLPSYKHLLKLSFQKVHTNCLFIILCKYSFTVSLYHTGFPDGTVADDDNFDRNFDLLLTQHLSVYFFLSQTLNNFLNYFHYYIVLISLNKMLSHCVFYIASVIVDLIF